MGVSIYHQSTSTLATLTIKRENYTPQINLNNYMPGTLIHGGESTPIITSLHKSLIEPFNFQELCQVI